MPEALISVLSAQVPLQALKTSPEGAASAAGNATAAPAPTGMLGGFAQALGLGSVFGGSPAKPNASWKGPLTKESDSQKGGADTKQEGGEASEGRKVSKGSEGSEK
jgi:hypothetical protein